MAGQSMFLMMSSSHLPLFIPATARPGRDEAWLAKKKKEMLASGVTADGADSEMVWLAASLFDRASAAAGDRLVAGRDYPPNSKRAVQRIKRHQRHRRRAIRIRDQPAMLPDVVAVDLGNNERHLGFHPKNRRVVDDDRARVARDGGIFPRNISAGAEEGQVDSFERLLGELLRDDFFAAKRNAPASRTLGAQWQQSLHWKGAPVQNPQQFVANGTGRADNRNVIAFLCVHHGASYRRFR